MTQIPYNYENTSYHAIERVQERFGLNPTSTQALIFKALERGRTSESFTAKERKYMQNKEKYGNCRVLYYQSFLFIVDLSGICITAYAAPKWFNKKTHYDGKTKIINVKKYMKFNISPGYNAA